MDGLIKLTGLWKNENSLAGNLGAARVMVVKNKYKKNPKEPDYNLLIAKSKKRDDAEEPEDDIPF